MQVIKKNFKLYILQLLYLERIQLQYFANAYYRIIRCTTNTSVKQRHKRAVRYIRFHCKLAKQISLGISRISLRSNKTRRKANKTAQVSFRTLGQIRNRFLLCFLDYFTRAYALSYAPRSLSRPSSLRFLTISSNLESGS